MPATTPHRRFGRGSRNERALGARTPVLRRPGCGFRNEPEGEPRAAVVPAPARRERARVRPVLGAATVVLALLAGPGCSGGDDDVDSASTPTSSTNTTVRPTVTTASPGPPGGEAGAGDGDTHDEDLHGEGVSELVTTAQDLLVTAEELGAPDLAERGYNPDAGPDRCGAAADGSHPPDLHVGTVLGGDAGQVTEAIRIHPSVEDAAAAFEAVVASGPCSEGEGLDLAGRVDGDRAVAIETTDGDELVTTVLVLLSDAVLTFEVRAPDGATGLPDPVDVAAFGAGKILAALEAA